MTIIIKNETGEVRTDQILVIGYLSIFSNNLPHLQSSGFYSLILFNLYQFKNKNRFTLDYVEVEEFKQMNIDQITFNRRKSSAAALLKKELGLGGKNDDFDRQSVTMLNEDV